MHAVNICREEISKSLVCFTLVIIAANFKDIERVCVKAGAFLSTHVCFFFGTEHHSQKKINFSLK